MNKILKSKTLPNYLREIINVGVFLTLLTPLVVSPKFFFPYVGPKSLYFMGLVEIIFAVWLILVIFAPQYRPKSNLLFWTITIFVFYLVLSSLWGVNFSNSFWSKYERMTGLLLWFHLLAFFIVLTSVFKRQKDWFLIFAVSTGVAVLLSFVNFFPEKIPLFQGARQGATLGNSSFLGTYLLFNIFLALILFIKSAEIGKIFSALALAIMIFALYKSGAQAAFLCFLGGLFLLSLFYLIFAARKLPLRIGGLALLLIISISALVFVYLAFQQDSDLHQRIIQRFTRARFVVWEIGWQGWQERPWLGWGAENFDVIFAKYFNPCLFLRECGSEIWFDRAHNIVLDIGVTTGFLGLISYLAIFGASFYLLFRKYLFRKYLNPKEKPQLSDLRNQSNQPMSDLRNQSIGFWISGSLAVLLIAYFVQNLTVFDMVSSLMMFFLILGFVEIFSRRDEIRSHYENRSHIGQTGFSFGRIILAGVLMILMAFSFFNFVIQPLKADQYVIKAVQSQNPAQRVLLFEKTLQTSPLGKYQIRDFFGQQTLGFANSQAAKKISPEEFKKEIDFVSQELEKSIKEFPLDFRSYLTLGKLYNLYTILEPAKAAEAERVLKRAIELSPANQQGYLALAQTKFFQKNFQEAFDLAEKALDLEPRIPTHHLIVIQIAKQMGNQELAEKKAKEALEMHPGLREEVEKILGR